MGEVIESKMYTPGFYLIDREVCRGEGWSPTAVALAGTGKPWKIKLQLKWIRIYSVLKDP